jgi:predicted oxidoreductase
MADTVSAGIARAVTVIGALRQAGEAVEDEWQYVTDLETVWSARLREVATARGADPLAPALAEALDELAAQAAAVTDAHRAIDWLSTYPQAVLAVLGEPA